MSEYPGVYTHAVVDNSTIVFVLAADMPPIHGSIFDVHHLALVYWYPASGSVRVARQTCVVNRRPGEGDDRE